MTKQPKSGGTNNVSIEGDLNDLKPGNFVVDNDTKYDYGADLNTEGTPLIDTGIGKIVSIRTFEFKMNPAIKELPSKQDLFNHHARQITTILWSDSLRPMEEFAPRVIIDTKKKVYKIHVVCEARLNQMFIDSPTNLSEQLLKENKNGTTGR